MIWYNKKWYLMYDILANNCILCCKQDLGHPKMRKDKLHLFSYSLDEQNHQLWNCMIYFMIMRIWSLLWPFTQDHIPIFALTLKMVLILCQETWCLRILQNANTLCFNELRYFLSCCLIDSPYCNHFHAKICVIIMNESLPSKTTF